jgi:type IV pilus assembly protein PilC
MEFRCRLVTAAGEVVEGVYAAENEARLRHELEERGLHVLSLRPRGGIAGWSVRLPRRRKLPAREFLEFNQQLATLLKAGMPLVQSLDLLRAGVTDPVLRPVLDSVHDRVKAGAALSEAFDDHGELFPRVYTASLLAGERSGNLETMLRRYVAYARLLAGVRRKTVSALIYPAVLFTLGSIVVGIIVLRLVPAFAGFYDTFDAELPLLTRVIVSGSTLLSNNLLVAALLAVVVGGGVWWWMTHSSQRVRVDRAVLRLPMLGDIARKFAVSQLARTVATLLGGGIPLVNALDVAARSVSNQYVAGQLEGMAQDVREGQSLAGTMRARPVFPDVAVRMTEVGEATGALQEMLTSLAEFYDEEIETRLDRFVTLIEPALLVTIGLVIAVLLLAVYLPVFELSSVID